MTDLSSADSLEGQLLIAMPNMMDGRFDHSVVYLCSHSEQGAMGLILNQIARHLSLEDLLIQLNILNDETAIRLPSKIREMNVHKGGPVEVERGFVLHSDDFVIDRSTLSIADGICLTATLEILKAMAEGGRAGAGNACAWLFRLGRRGNWRAKSRRTVGSPVRQARSSCSIPSTMTNGNAPCFRSASIRQCFSVMPVTPEPGGVQSSIGRKSAVGVNLPLTGPWFCFKSGKV